MADYYLCPGCGNDVKVGSAGCPKCNHLDPWEVESDYPDGVNLPGDEFDYDKFCEDEFGSSVPKRGLPLLWWITAVVLLIVFTYWIVG